jgi:hypothetical protein
MQAETLPTMLERLRALYPDTVYAIQATATDPAWKSVVDVLAALATVAVGLFAFLEVRRANRAERDLNEEAAARIRATKSRVSAEAFAFRHLLHAWLQRSPWEGGPSLPPQHGMNDVKGWAAEFGQQRANTDQLSLSMMSKAAEAPAETQTALNNMNVKYHFGVSRLEDALRPGHSDEQAGLNVIMAEHAMRGCQDSLDAVIDPGLLASMEAHVGDLGHHDLSKQRYENLQKMLKGQA